MTEQWAAWTPEPEDTAAAAAAPGGFAQVFSQVRPDPGEGKTLEQVLGRALRPDRPEVPRDQDEAVANLLARGYVPGQVSDLARQLAEVETELAAEEEKIERGHKRAERIMRDHQAGKITAFDIARMQDFDEGDASRAVKLARRRERLRAQLEEVSQRITPAPVLDDPFTSARRAAHAAFTAASWEAIRAVQEGRAPAPGPRPFAGPGGGGAPDCAECQAAGATRSESAAIHAEARRDAAAAAAPYWPGDVITTAYEAVR
jgi:hypothetical protein